MTMEEYIIQELKDEKAKRENLEIKVRELEDERCKVEKVLREVEWLVKETDPCFTKSRNIWLNSALLTDGEVERAMRVFARLGVQVKSETEEEPK